MFSKSFALLATTISLLPLVSAHGNVHKVVSGGQTSVALNPYYPVGESAVRVMLTNSLPNAFVEPYDYPRNDRMACPDAGNKPAALHLTVQAGATVDIHWQGASGELDNFFSAEGEHPYVHATGFIADYLADCNGDCTKFDATNAGWTKIQHDGISMSEAPSPQLINAMQVKNEIYYPRQGNGLWAPARMIQNRSIWSVPIPSALKDGKYILRTDMSNMHSPGANQHYIGCIQINVLNGGGVPLPAGTQAKDLYSRSDPNINFSVYADDPNTFRVPGPAVWSPSGGSTPVPEPTKPEQPTTPEEPETEPETPVPPPGGSPSVPPTPPQPSATPEPPKCRQRKRALPSPIAVSKRHRRRLNAEH